MQNNTPNSEDESPYSPQALAKEAQATGNRGSLPLIILATVAGISASIFIINAIFANF